MASQKIKQPLLKAGFKKKQLKDILREDIFKCSLKLRQEAEEKSAVGGAVEKAEENRLDLCL